MKMIFTKKDKLQLVFILMLVILFVFLFNLRITKIGMSRKVVVAGGEKTTNFQAVPFYFKLEKESQAIVVQRDPFSRANTSSRKKSGNLYLAGIIYEEGNSTAVIDDQIVHIGEEIGGYQVISITPRVVTLSKGDQQVVLELE